jgi:hypothetical protein
MILKELDKPHRTDKFAQVVRIAEDQLAFYLGRQNAL